MITMNKQLVRKSTALLCTMVLAAALYHPVEAAADEDITRTPSASSSSTSFEKSTLYKHTTIKKRLANYQEVNKEVKAWLTIPGTNINEPILYNPQNNNYYLYRDWRGVNYPNTNWKNFPITATYVDYRHKWGDTWKKSSKNTILYGHNWTNLRNPLTIGNAERHTMFAQLPSYTDKTFAQEHPHIYYSTAESEGIWRVFAVGYCEVSPNFFYNAPNPGKAHYQMILDEWQKRSLYNFDVDVNTTDRILTLSTCSRVYNLGENQRFVVVARLLREGESENDTVKLTVNQNVKEPKL